MKKNFTIWLPLIIGIPLGIISVALGKVPKSITQWTGMSILGNHVGYLLGSLTVAYFNSQSWIKSFITSSLTIIIATLIYYLLIYFDLRFIDDGIIPWCIIGIVCGILSATAMWLMNNLKSRPLRLTVFFGGYLSMISVIYYYIARYYINLHLHDPEVIVRMGKSTAGAVFEVVFAIAITTLLWIAAWRKFFRSPKENEISVASV